MPRKARTDIDLASQIALRSHGASRRPSISRCSRSATNARVRPTRAVNTIATQSSPLAARSELCFGSAKWKTTSVETTKRSIAGSVSRARSSSVRSFRARTATSATYRLTRRPGSCWQAAEAAVEVEVLDGRQLAVNERLVPRIADRLAEGAHVKLAGGRKRKPGAEAQERGLPRTVRPGDEHEPAALDLEVETVENPL